MGSAPRPEMKGLQLPLSVDILEVKNKISETKYHLKNINFFISHRIILIENVEFTTVKVSKTFFTESHSQFLI